ncbi:hypothetical protein [Demequina sp.]|uniref:hypothetical protein n=1 Tax=Demequina sp. TaxID=2050685 RepID=UPI0025B7F4C1|nr:hypothetical protein [Demequina sp.]
MSSLSTAEPAARERVVGHGQDAYEAVRARVAAVAAVAHQALDVPSRVTMLPGDAVAVAEPTYGAVTLQEMLESRGSLRAGECVWLGMAVAGALAALHRDGLAHGAVGADAVRLPSRGVVVGKLVDGPADATAADDVAALGRMLAMCVDGPEAEPVRAWTEPMTHQDPAARPTAAMVARALGSCAPPEPLHHLPRGVASSMRASAVLPGSVRKLPQARIWRWRQAARVWSPKVVLALGAGLVVALGAWGLWSLMPGASKADPLTGGVVPAQQDPAWVAREATQARFDALQSSGPEALAHWTAEGSPARAEAEATSAALASGRMVVDGLVASIDHVVVQPAEAGTPDVRVVRVTYTLSDHVVTMDGEATRFEGYSQTVDLELVRGDDGWLVRSAADASADAAT